MSALTKNLQVAICKDAADAVSQGYNYREPEYKPVAIEKAVVVKNGTVEGNSTVDLILRDEHGNRYVTMISGRLLKTIPTEF